MPEELFGFKIGDRVVAVIDNPSRNHTLRMEDTGTVVCFDPYSIPIGVQWDTHVANGHDCCGNASDGCGWYVYPYEITRIGGEVEEIKPLPVDELFNMLGF